MSYYLNYGTIYARETYTTHFVACEIVHISEFKPMTRMMIIWILSAVSMATYIIFFWKTIYNQLRETQCYYKEIDPMCHTHDPIAQKKELCQLIEFEHKPDRVSDTSIRDGGINDMSYSRVRSKSGGWGYRQGRNFDPLWGILPLFVPFLEPLAIFLLCVCVCVCVSCPPFFEAPRFALRGGWDT